MSVALQFLSLLPPITTTLLITSLVTISMTIALAITTTIIITTAHPVVQLQRDDGHGGGEGEREPDATAPLLL